MMTKHLKIGIASVVTLVFLTVLATSSLSGATHVNIQEEADVSMTEAVEVIAEDAFVPLRLTATSIQDSTFANDKVLVPEESELLTSMNEIATYKEEIPDFPFEVDSLGEMTIVGHNTKINHNDSRNVKGMTVTINPNVVPYKTIVYIEGLGFRYNQPSDYVREDKNVYVHFSSEEEAAKWTNQNAKIYIVHNEPYLDFSGHEKVSVSSRGRFGLTAYCSCRSCCGKWGGSPEGKTGAIGAYVYEGVTVAADPSVLAYGSVIYIEGLGIRFVNDCGGAINNKRIDVYFTDHDRANEFGYQHMNVYKISN